MQAAHWTPIGERNYTVDPGKQELISHWNDFQELTFYVSAVDESGNASGSQSDTVNLSLAGPSNSTDGTIETTDSVYVGVVEQDGENGLSCVYYAWVE